jgi:hypothetical protein
VKKTFCQLALFLFLTIHSPAQTIHSPVKPGYIQFGAYSRNFSDVFSFVSNQAALSSLKQGGAGVYSGRRFFLKELNLSTLAIAVPVKNGGIGFQAIYFGFSDYSESQLGIAYAKKLGSLVDIGVQFNYYMVRISGYGNAGAVNFEIGMLFHPTEKFHLGFHVYNPAGGGMGKNSNEKLASIYQAGMGYEVSDQLFLSTEIVKEENKPVNINAGLQYVFAGTFFMRAGIATQPASPFAGAGLRWKLFRLDITVDYHPQLGFSPGLLLICHFKNNPK